MIWWKRLLVLICCWPLLLAGQRNTVIIDEIMADPTPQVGLPSQEWIEVKNVSGVSINLQNWRVGDAGSSSGALPAYVLQADSFVIICPTAAVAALSAFGPAIGVSSFPSLDNDGDIVYLRAANGTTIHAVQYKPDWYGSNPKKEGGWTLEMIDTNNPCTGIENWKASIHPAGGTPGRRNSIAGSLPDSKAPHIIRAYVTDPFTVRLVVDETLDSTQAVDPTHYRIENGPPIQAVSVIAPLFNEVQLRMSMALLENRLYEVSVASLSDCAGNRSAEPDRLKLGLPASPAVGDCVINELLFNPRPGAYDYVEIFNCSENVFDASKMFIGNRNTSGAVSSLKALSPVPFYIYPGEFLVLTDDPVILGGEYFVAQPGQVLALSLPSFPDDKGTVVLLNGQGDIIDELAYSEKWHFKLVDQPEGVALERILPRGSSSDKNNWHSAASTSGYGTPTAPNSQYRRMNTIDATFTITPAVFSPDNDGRDDVLLLQYQVDGPGYMGTVEIYDTQGRRVRGLVNNRLLGPAGSWTWDGLDEQEKKLPAGVYILIAEFFHIDGRKKRFKRAVVLARPLN